MVIAMEKSKVPNNIGELHHFFGITDYYRKFMPLFEDITKIPTVSEMQQHVAAAFTTNMHTLSTSMQHTEQSVTSLTRK